MNPENRTFSNHEEETNENKAENKEKKEYVNLSFAYVADLVKQIEEKGYFDQNEYQDSCSMAVVYNKKTEKYDYWEFEDESRNTTIYDDLPLYYKKSGDEEMKILFCASKFDIRLKYLQDADFNEFFNSREKKEGYLTPDGVYYKFAFSPKGKFEGVVYSDEKQLPISEVKRIREFIGRNKDIDYDDIEKRINL